MKNENLLDVLLCSGKIKSGIMVTTKLIPEMEVYGYIPLCNDERAIFADRAIFGLDFNMSNTIVVSNRLAIVYPDFSLGTYGTKLDKIRVVHPILKTIEMQENGKDYKLPLNILYIPQYINNQAYKEFKSAVVYKGYGNKLRQLEGISSKTNEELHQTEYSYTPKEEEFLFSDSSNHLVKAVGSEFCVVCRHINHVTGALTYELLQPEDLSIIEDNEKDS